MDSTFSFVVNGEPRTVTTDPDRPLLEVLREDFHLTGTKYGCGEGECRACTVLLDGHSSPSCLTPVREASGKSVRTIEGLSKNGALHPVQEAFLSTGAFQCGYCTPGMIMGLAAVMEKNPAPNEAEILAELERHICRCGGYVKYLSAANRLVAISQTNRARE